MTGAQLRQATLADLPQISRFLKENGLPTNGVKESVENFIVATDEKSWIGIAGLEVYGRSGLLRSVAIAKDSRGLGHGRTLVNAVVDNARARGIETLYLLTDSAEPYFRHLGFEVVKREDIDEAVKASVEFTECCESAAAMRRSLR